MIVEMLTGGGLVVVGVLLGRFLPGRKSTSPKTPKPLCCEHTYGKHDPKTGKCNAVIQQSKYFDGGFDGYEYVPCRCLRYDGPQPLESFYATEIADGGGA